MISRYDSFIGDLLLENLINESMIYFSPALRKQLNKVSAVGGFDDISSDLLGIESTDIKPDITFIDLDKEGFLSFSTMRNVKKVLDEKFPDIKDRLDLDQKSNKDLADDIWYLHNQEYNLKPSSPLRGAGNFDDGPDPYVKGRNQIAIGRLVNKVFPGKYTSKQVEDFVNSFKAVVEKSGEHFELVSGDDIAFWYNSDNYKERSGTLGNSCMAQKRNIFNIYVKNPDICRLLILREDDKILGRALVWKFESIRSGIGEKFEGVEYFMDRQYTIKDSDVNKFRNFSKEQGWIYKTNNNHHSFTNITYNGKEINVDMVLQVARFGGDYEYSRYPYMDTFRRYDPRIGKLYNDDDQESDQEGCYILEDTGGGYTEVEGGVWSEWHDRMIPEDEAVYSEAYSDHLLRDYAVRVDIGNSRRRGWYHQDDDDIVFDEWIDEYIHVDDSVYSESYGYSLFRDNAVEVAMNIESDGDVDSDDNWHHKKDDDIIEIDTDSSWYDKFSDEFRSWRNFEYVMKDEMIKNYKGEWIPRVIKTEIFKVSQPKQDEENPVDITGYEYLHPVDALALGYELMEESVDGNEKRVIDWIEYNDSISELITTISERLESKVKKYRYILKNEGQLRLDFGKEEEEEYKIKIKSILDKLQSRLSDIENDTWIY
jgi:hypothetical protein